jgi:hypothetical protein
MHNCICCHLQIEPGQGALVAVSDSSDRSKDKHGDQKVHVLMQYSSFWFMLFLLQFVMKYFAHALEFRHCAGLLKIARLQGRVVWGRRYVNFSFLWYFSKVFLLHFYRLLLGSIPLMYGRHIIFCYQGSGFCFLCHTVTGVYLYYCSFVEVFPTQGLSSFACLRLIKEKKKHKSLYQFSFLWSYIE